ncbi:MAG: DEAD/DEAH box helicase, partial [Gemmataceae bacterium]
RVRYLLQARDDPSLFLPVAEAWKEKSKAAQILRKRSFQPREYLLTALGQAAAFSPQIEKSLKSAVPSEFVTDASHAYEFLTQGCWMLEQAGFTILLPSWWTRKGGKHRLSAQAVVQSPTQTSGQGMSLGQMLDFDWKIALGSEEMSLEELLELARAKMPLVKVRGQWVQVRADDLQAAIALLERERAGKATLRDIVQMSLGGGEAPGGLPFAGVKASGWIAEFLSQLEGQGAFTELPPPPGFQGTLRPYQIRGYSWLSFLRQWGLGACLADDMGLGKTIQTLAMLQRDWMTNQKPCLLICPTSVVANWKKEAERFTPDLPVLIHHGGRRTKGDAFSSQVKKVALVLSSYSLLHRDRDLFDQVKWSGIILDEAQNVKNPQTKQSLAARSLRADYRLALTGTPVENHVGDLWAILEFLNPGWLGSQSDFRKRYFIPIQAQQDAEAALHLRRLTNPFILRRLKTDKAIIADLPEKLEMKVYCNLTREQATLYQSVVDDLNQSLDDVDGIKRKGIILATLTKLKQVCNHPLQFLGDQSAIPGRSGKLARLTEMLEEMLESEERALIFTQFTEMGEILKKHLQETFGKEVLFLHGGVARESRVRMVDRFQNEAEGPRLFLLSLKAGGTGLNLTRATHVFHFDRWWNPAVENQATDRAFRIGQDKMVQVHKFICAGTVEDRIDEMIERKEAVASRVVAAREDWLTEMSNDQLRDLFKLRQEAIGD